MTRKFNMALLFFALFAVLPFDWFMLDASTTPGGAKQVRIGQLRMLATSIPGSLPNEARYETIGRRRVVSDLLAAGSGLRPVGLAIRAYELVFPDGRLITIDRGMTRKLAEQHRVSDFDPVAQALVDAATANASLNLLLSSEPQHSGSSASLPAAGPSPAPVHDVADGIPYAVAPGVVVIPADSIRPGDRMIYARLSDRREILFAGDVAVANVSQTEQRPPARLMTTFFTSRDREQIGQWLRTIRAIKAAAPSLQIVAGHDPVVPRALTHGFATHRAE